MPDPSATPDALSTPDHADRPHIVMIMCDQLRPDAVGFAGNDLVRTPNIDRLAARGAIFENMYPQGSVCMPSRAAILTGRYPRTCRMSHASVLDPRETTLPEVLQRSGYRTGLFGKLHVTAQQYTLTELKTDDPISDAAVFCEPAGIAPPDPDDPAKQHYGFMEHIEHEDTLWGPYGRWLAEREPRIAKLLEQGMNARAAVQTITTKLYPDSQLADVNTVDLPAELHPSWFIGSSAAEFFERNCVNEPLFMQVSFVDPHHPFDPPAEIAKNYPPENMPLPKYRDTGDITWPPSLAARMPDFSNVSDNHARTTIAHYYAMMETLDHAVGHLVDTIDKAGQLENTLFVFVADHGELLGDYGLWRKGSFHYDCIIRVPSFIAYPKRIEPGQRLNGMTQAIDLAPTLLGFAGVDIPDAMQGRDLSAKLSKGDDIDRGWIYTELFTAYWGPFVHCWTVRTHEAKYTYFGDDRVGHLFDLVNDPDERRDVYHDPAYRDLRHEMMELMQHELRLQDDPLPRLLTQF